MYGPDGTALTTNGGASARAPSIFGGVWLVSFADLISLLVSFFILLYSMSDVPPAAWTALREGLARGLGQDSAPAPDPMRPARVPLGDSVGLNLDYLAVLLAERMAGDAAGAAMTIARRGDRIVIALSDADLLGAGPMTVSDDTAGHLARLAALLAHVRNRVEVLAFVPRSEENAGELAWTRAIGRAQAVAQSLNRSGLAHGAIALATADASAPASVDIDASANGRMERIEIHVLGVAP